MRLSILLLLVFSPAALAAGPPPADPFVTRLAVLVLAAFVGYYVIWAVTPALHTPLMSMTNAISGVVVVGAIIAAVSAPSAELNRADTIARGLGLTALTLAAINIAGGFLVTRRMLAMYKRKPRPPNDGPLNDGKPSS